MYPLETQSIIRKSAAVLLWAMGVVSGLVAVMASPVELAMHCIAKLAVDR
jgi:hypothetical protein